MGREAVWLQQLLSAAGCTRSCHAVQSTTDHKKQLSPAKTRRILSPESGTASSQHHQHTTAALPAKCRVRDHDTMHHQTDSTLLAVTLDCVYYDEKRMMLPADTW
jgi:hypothetical protein